MTVPSRDIDGCRRSHGILQNAIAKLTDHHARQPSLLPGWTVGHVLSHLARNADSVVRRLEGALRNKIVDQYAGGYEGRATEIEAGANRPAHELIDDVRATNATLDALMASVNDEVWDRPTRRVNGDERPASSMAFSRWREVEVHMVDLGLGYSSTDWPPGLVEAWLPRMLASLPDRADANLLLAWTIGRGPAPDLIPWG